MILTDNDNDHDHGNDNNDDNDDNDDNGDTDMSMDDINRQTCYTTIRNNINTLVVVNYNIVLYIMIDKSE